MSGPGVIRLKRKRDQQPPDTLIVEPQRKRVQGVDGEFRAHYVRRPEPASDGQSASAGTVFTNPATSTSGGPIQNELPKRRLFKIRPLISSDRGSRAGRTGGNAVATIVETRTPQKQRPAGPLMPANETLSPAPSPLKRPGRGAITPRPQPENNGNSTSTVKDESQLQAIADALSRFADDELEKSAKPKLLATPKLSGLRSREIHAQRSAGANIFPSQGDASDIDMVDDDHDYVYDTYILSSKPDAESTPFSESLEGRPANVGYIVITDEDQAVWDTFLADEHDSDKEVNEDDEDENAEDWYGADYPEDEVASDDEFGRNAYGYRRGNDSDDEQWDKRDGSWSDSEVEGVDENGMKLDPLNMTTEQFIKSMRDDGKN